MTTNKKQTEDISIYYNNQLLFHETGVHLKIFFFFLKQCTFEDERTNIVVFGNLHNSISD
jgi:hypothetical protein